MDNLETMQPPISLHAVTVVEGDTLTDPLDLGTPTFSSYYLRFD